MPVRRAALACALGLVLVGCGVRLPFESSQRHVCGDGVDAGQCEEAIQQAAASVPDIGTAPLVVVEPEHPPGQASFGGVSLLVIVPPSAPTTSGFGLRPPTWIVSRSPAGWAVEPWRRESGPLPDHVISALHSLGVQTEP